MNIWFSQIWAEFVYFKRRQTTRLKVFNNNMKKVIKQRKSYHVAFQVILVGTLEQKKIWRWKVWKITLFFKGLVDQKNCKLFWFGMIWMFLKYLNPQLETNKKILIANVPQFHILCWNTFHIYDNENHSMWLSMWKRNFSFTVVESLESLKWNSSIGDITTNWWFVIGVWCFKDWGLGI